MEEEAEAAALAIGALLQPIGGGCVCVCVRQPFLCVKKTVQGWRS